MTGLTAATFGFRDRGVLRQGAFADITLFDAERVGEAATFAKPIQPAHGIHSVFVNGRAVWQEGRPTGERPGRRVQRGAPGA
jgi:N-acyl-D-amino-acid deacylase